MRLFALIATVFLLSVVTSNYLYGQEEYSNQDNNGQEYIKLVRAWSPAIADATKGWSMSSFKEGKNYRVTSKYNNGDPKQVSFEFVLGTRFGGEWTSIDGTYTADVLFKDDLPFAVRSNRMDEGEYNMFPFNGAILVNEPQRYSEAEQKKIMSLYREFQTERIIQSPSFQEVLHKHNSYPSNYDMKNCLEIVSKVEPRVYIKIIDNPDFGNGLVVTRQKEILDFGNGTVSYYKNRSNHPIVIKGIYRKRMSGGQYEFYDVSLTLKPGEMTDYFVIHTEYDFYSDYNVQFIGDVGTITHSKG